MGALSHLRVLSTDALEDLKQVLDQFPRFGLFPHNAAAAPAKILPSVRISSAAKRVASTSFSGLFSSGSDEDGPYVDPETAEKSAGQHETKVPRGEAEYVGQDEVQKSIGGEHVEEHSVGDKETGGKSVKERVAEMEREKKLEEMEANGEVPPKELESAEQKEEDLEAEGEKNAEHNNHEPDAGDRAKEDNEEEMAFQKTEAEEEAGTKTPVQEHKEEEDEETEAELGGRPEGEAGPGDGEQPLANMQGMSDQQADVGVESPTGEPENPLAESS
ncbi:unnamed protein product [Amoebophrya sp. A120]|nr:unnamed protein product [Amoebophrya sp. A120]|eukprot:GSA120T00011709001.1